MTMPPYAEWYRGRAAVAAFLAEVPLAAGRRWRVEATTANGQPALAFSTWDEQIGAFLSHGLSRAHLRAGRHHGVHHLPRAVGGADLRPPRLLAWLSPTASGSGAACPTDAEALAHLHLDVWDDAYTGLMPQGILDDRRDQVDERVERWRDILGQDKPNWLAEDADGLVGFAGGRAALGTTTSTSTLELYALYVRASYYGTGVGYALFEQAVGDRAAYLWVLAGQRARDPLLRAPGVPARRHRGRARRGAARPDGPGRDLRRRTMRFDLRRPRLRRHLGGGARGARGGLVRRDDVGLGGAAVRRGERAAARPAVPPGQRPLAGAERHPLRAVLRLVAGDAARRSRATTTRGSGS